VRLALHTDVKYRPLELGDGRFFIDLEGRTVELAPQRAVVLMIEGKGVIPTGD